MSEDKDNLGLSNIAAANTDNSFNYEEWRDNQSRYGMLSYGMHDNQDNIHWNQTNTELDLISNDKNNSIKKLTLNKNSLNK